MISEFLSLTIKVDKDPSSANPNGIRQRIPKKGIGIFKLNPATKIESLMSERPMDLVDPDKVIIVLVGWMALLDLLSPPVTP